MNNMQRIATAAVAIAMTAAMSVTALASEAPDDLYTLGNDNSYGGEFSTQSNSSQLPAPESSAPDAVESHVVTYYLRSGDKGTLEFEWARIEGRKTIGGSCTPAVNLPGGWYLDGYYINGVRHTAAQIAAYQLSTPTLEIEVRTFPSESNAGSDDRKETYTINFYIRSGDKGTLKFDTATVKGTGNTLDYSDIPTLTTTSAKKYSIKGYYVDGAKYSRSSLAKLKVESDLDVEVRTYRDSSGSTDAWDDCNGYDWRYDLGYGVESYGYRACGCLYNCSHSYGYNYGGDIQASLYGGLYIGGYYYPDAGFSNLSYPYAYPYASPSFGQCTVTFVPQNGQGALTTSVWSGGKLAKPVNPVCSGYTFLGWSTARNGSTGYWNFSTYSVNKNLTLYGIWKKTAGGTTTIPAGSGTVISTDQSDYCKVTLRPGNGEDYGSVQVKKNNTIAISGTPKFKGYVFVGWAKDKDGSVMWDFINDKVTKDTTLYGVWRKATTTTNPT